METHDVLENEAQGGLSPFLWAAQCAQGSCLALPLFQYGY